MTYSNPVLDRFLHPRHVGTLSAPAGLGVVGTPGEGDFVQMFIAVANGKVAEARFRCFTCPVAIAACDVAAELVEGLSLEEARRLPRADIASALGGVPEEKMSRCQLAVAAVQSALENLESSKER